jgi:high-affinity nickel-transport protein
VNLFVLVSISKLYRQMRSGRYDPGELERQLDKRGIMNRLLGGYARHVDTSWKLYPVGFLFGLGFDTATEIALLVLAGSAVVGGLPLYAILSLPVLFAAGMCTFDTLDGLFMNFAYDWAFANPVRKVFYNLTITGLSVAVAFLVGTIEILGLIGQQANLGSPFWDFVRGFNLNTAGFVIVGLFVVTWAVALLYWRLARVEEKWSSALPQEQRDEVMAA